MVLKINHMSKVNIDTQKYNKKLKGEYKQICDLLAEEITRALPKAENKIWHANPVWFIDGNPIVGYDKLKDCVRLLFWSGQSFKEKGLHKEGSFKAAEARYTEVSQISKKDLKRWLQKAKEIQWDYKNIVKRKGVLKKVSTAKKSDLVGGYTIKYHANGKTMWSKGKIKDGKTEGYWQWFRPDGTLKRSGNFKAGEAVGEWTTYDSKGKVYKVTAKK